jgi:YhcH/YjgK/YiaL family protein
MIADKLENWNLYFTGAEWTIVAVFLASLHEGTPEGEYPLKGKEIFARVMSYETRNPDEARLEGHRSYIDIQSVLDGGEGIAWCPTGNLETVEAYEAGMDVEFYVSPAQFPARVDVRPGYFVALFPHDAHMPQLRVSGMPSWVKKVVVKVDVSLYPGKAVKGE